MKEQKQSKTSKRQLLSRLWNESFFNISFPHRNNKTKIFLGYLKENLLEERIKSKILKKNLLLFGNLKLWDGIQNPRKFCHWKQCNANSKVEGNEM